MTRIKICGITNYEDAIQAIRLGCDAVGFIFAKSPRNINLDKVKTICEALPPFINKVGVFVNQSTAEILNTVNYCGLDIIQLHGSESTIDANDTTIPIIKAFKARNADIVDEIQRERCQVFLLDSFISGMEGGTGQSFDWNIARKASEIGNLVLAGGLDHKNIVSALDKVRPYAVDVCSGVEKKPGLKDHKKLQQFINEVRKWDNRIS